MHKNDNAYDALCLEAIISLLPGHVYWKDVNGVFFGCNDAQARSAGFSSSKEMIGKNDNDMPWKDQAKQIRENDKQVIESGKEQVKEEVSVLSNGEERVFLSRKVPLVNGNGKNIGILGISVDITKQKEIERQLKETQGQLEEANKIQLSLLKMINHESRKPLHEILGVSQLFLKKNISDYETKEELYKAMRDQMKIIYKFGVGFMDLVSYLCDFVEYDVVDSKLPENKLDVQNFFEVITADKEDSCEYKGIKFNLMFDGNVPKSIYVNSSRLLKDVVLRRMHAVCMIFRKFIYVDYIFIVCSFMMIELEVNA